jgi:hypothetical protein
LFEALSLDSKSGTGLLIQPRSDIPIEARKGKATFATRMLCILVKELYLTHFPRFLNFVEESMDLQEELDAVRADITAKIPDLAAQFDADTEELVRQGVGTGGPTVGDVAPDFELPDQLGRTVRSIDLRAQGSLVVAFYRGSW